MDDTFNSFNYTIRGSYTPILNYQNVDLSNNFYISDLKQLIEDYTKEKKHFESEIFQLESDNIRLLQNIFFFDRRCYFINITHSNTINFIIANYSQLKNILDKLILIYNKNLDYINFKKEKIYSINLTINTLKSNINYYELNN